MDVVVYERSGFKFKLLKFLDNHSALTVGTNDEGLMLCDYVKMTPSDEDMVISVVETYDWSKKTGLDKDCYDGLNKDRNKAIKRRQDSLENVAERMGLTERVRFINKGTIILDERVYYYSKAKQARVKGKSKKYSMRGVAHFLEVFSK